MHSRYTSSLSFRGRGRRAATRPPRTSPGGEKAADTFYRRSQLRLARQGWLVMPGGERGEGWREEREREEIERGEEGDGAIKAPRQKPPRGTNGRLSSHLRLVHIPSKSGDSRGRVEAQKGEGVRGDERRRVGGGGQEIEKARLEGWRRLHK